MSSHPALPLNITQVKDLNPKEIKFSTKLRKKIGKDLFDLYKASRSLLLLIPNMIKSASTDDMRQSLEAQFEAVQVQVYKLESLFVRMKEKPKLVLTRTPTWMGDVDIDQKF